ncbi:MAG: TetR/AcrR family transcriptional regulator [Erysipelotrichaceae bacterium]|nr:TetR/AcrR family transcriptional regulator [Erysipelotrichaceae bacterium]
MRTKDLDKQARIKEAMIRLMLKEGIDGISVAKIAREAGVSPATIYIYYENKDDMMAEVFSEYAHSSYNYLYSRLHDNLSGDELIDALIRGTYDYALEHEDEFSFVEQCSLSPNLKTSVCQCDCCFSIFDLIHDYQNKGIIRDYSDQNIMAVLFAPVKFMVSNRSSYPDPDEGLDELIEMMKDMLLY